MAGQQARYPKGYRLSRIASTATGSFLVALCVLPFAPSLSAPMWTITDIGTIGGNYVVGVDINNRGEVTGNASYAGSGSLEHAFRYSGGSIR